VEPILGNPAGPHSPRPPVIGQDWADVAFLHWPIDREIAARLLPAGARVDALDGRTYLGLIALRMRERTLVGPVPLNRWYGQVNVRVYSTDESGRRAVTFASLSSGSRPVAAIGRAVLGLPYARARVELTRDGSVARYRCVQLNGSRAAVEFAVRVGASIAGPSPLEQFVTNRSAAHVRRGGVTVRVDNTHGPWPLHRAELIEFSGSLIAASGLPDPGPHPVSVLWSPGVRVTLRAPAVVRPRGA
jgi:uncharacterized protein YqjF (DUF2071 family)